MFDGGKCLQNLRVSRPLEYHPTVICEAFIGGITLLLMGAFVRNLDELHNVQH